MAPSHTTRQLFDESGPVDIDAALDVCEDITRSQASDLYHGTESLTAYRRRALCAIYAFACCADDAANGHLPTEEKLRLLGEARAGIPREGAVRPVDPVLVAIRDTARRFPLPLAALDALIEGAERDVQGCTYDTFHDLLMYCRQVGGSIARLAISVIGSRDPAEADRLADDFGVAVHLTAILGRMGEDFQRGRLYLPRDDLAQFNCPADLAAAPRESLERVVAHQVLRIREWYDRARPLLSLLDVRGASYVAEVTATNERILDRLERSPLQVAAITATPLVTMNEQAQPS
jgi:15-cis-phytoene synthase